jgi:peroxiredoxin
MKQFYLFCSFLIAVVCSAASNAALDRVGDFALLDDAGEFHQLSRYRHRKAMILMAYDESCTSMPGMVDDFRKLAAEYSEQDLEFFLIDSLDLGRATFAASDVGLPVLEDDGQLVSESLGIQSAGDVLVLNPERLSLYYRGSVTNELQQTLNGVLADSVSDTVSTASNDCAISYLMKDTHAQTPPDYVNDVAPIIIENCAECHKQGGVGPFALDSYIMVLGWSPMIREVLLNKRMPPTQVDPYIGHSDTARYVTKEELQTVIHWIDAGAPQGDSESDPLEALSAAAEAAENAEWALGEPDFIVTAPQHDVPPTGVMDYLYANVELPFTEDKWVRAIQYRAGDASVLHHLMTFVTAPQEDFWGAERDQTSVTRRFVEGYSPGNSNIRVFPEGTGVFIPQGHRLSMQFHYVTNGQRTTDETQLGLYFSDEEGLHEQLAQAVSSRFILPPNEPNHAMQAEYVFEENVVLTGVRARMNYRGKKMKFAVEEAGGSLREIFSVPAYNYGWQPHYILEQPEVIAAGTKVHVIGAFDNSVSNPTNPDPEKEISFGLNSWDEMFTGYFTFYSSP